MEYPTLAMPKLGSRCEPAYCFEQEHVKSVTACIATLRYFRYPPVYPALITGYYPPQVEVPSVSTQSLGTVLSTGYFGKVQWPNLELWYLGMSRCTLVQRAVRVLAHEAENTLNTA